MDRVRITGLKQGKVKLKDGGFAVGFGTKYGVVWVTQNSMHRFLDQNSHLRQHLIADRGFNSDNLIGRYIYISNKSKEVEHSGAAITTPLL